MKEERLFILILGDYLISHIVANAVPWAPEGRTRFSHQVWSRNAEDVCGLLLLYRIYGLDIGGEHLQLFQALLYPGCYLAVCFQKP